ncbi:hypothetical protein BD309DRAFT_862614 [Dichomitus squalens]|uniref:Uncharacterized protein n=1 Tax=Dichomitus squalens TaxID=114155 RepID=A0A4Q9NU58_9APHY|nr:hypothetical protein BD309DRAFT_862614 [Dichomitus squalens]TBU59196.1 hypothetical protein BD310DRAFT_817808 [Dichomitus squalens]
MDPLPALDNIFGAIFVGYSLGLAVYGSNLQQSYRYFRLHSADRWSLKAVVVLLLVLDTVHMGTIAQILYHYLISSFFDPFALLTRNWCTLTMPLFFDATVVVAQGFYVRRIYTMNRGYRPILLLIVVLMLVESSMYAQPPKASRFGLAPLYSPDLQLSLWQRLNLVGIAIAVLTDLLLASTLVYILRRARTEFNNTNSLLDTLIVYTVNTCVLTGGFLVLSLIFLAAFPETDIFLGFLIPGARTYTASVLAVLNSRKSLSERIMKTNDAGTFGLVSFRTPKLSGGAIISPDSGENLVHRTSSIHFQNLDFVTTGTEFRDSTGGNQSVTDVFVS